MFHARKIKASLRCSAIAFVLLISIFSFIHFKNNSDKQTGTTLNANISNSTAIPDQNVLKSEIFFIEAKPGKHHLTAKESCSIETASMNHPNLIVTVYNAHGNFNASGNYVKFVSTLPNVHLKFLNATEAFSGTPFEDWYKDNALNSSYHPAEHLSDALRLAILHKTGGIYLDTDCIVLKPLIHFRNTIGDMGLNTANNAVLIFDKHSEMIFEYMNEFVRDFDGTVYNHQGTFMADKLVKKFCNSRSLRKIYNKPERCRGITVKPPETFQPLNPMRYYRIFDARLTLDLSRTCVFHLTGKSSRLFNAILGDGSFIDRLFKTYCPFTYQLIPKDGDL